MWFQFIFGVKKLGLIGLIIGLVSYPTLKQLLHKYRVDDNLACVVHAHKDRKTVILSLYKQCKHDHRILS